MKMPLCICEGDGVTVIKRDNRIAAAISPGICYRRAVIPQNAITSMPIERVLAKGDIREVTIASVASITSHVIRIAFPT